MLRFLIWFSLKFSTYLLFLLGIVVMFVSIVDC